MGTRCDLIRHSCLGIVGAFEADSFEPVGFLGVCGSCSGPAQGPLEGGCMAACPVSGQCEPARTWPLPRVASFLLLASCSLVRTRKVTFRLQAVSAVVSLGEARDSAVGNELTEVCHLKRILTQEHSSLDLCHLDQQCRRRPPWDGPLSEPASTVGRSRE